MNTEYLLDEVIEILHLKNDAALARTLNVAPPVISKMRTGSLKVGNSMIIAIHESTGMTIAEIKRLAGLPAARVSA